MPVDPNTIAKGKCYRTVGDQQRRVCDIVGNQVTYESWGGHVGNHTGHLKRNTVNRDGFAEAVEAEISCPADMNPLS